MVKVNSEPSNVFFRDTILATPSESWKVMDGEQSYFGRREWCMTSLFNVSAASLADVSHLLTSYAVLINMVFVSSDLDDT